MSLQVLAYVSIWQNNLGVLQKGIPSVIIPIIVKLTIDSLQFLKNTRIVGLMQHNLHNLSGFLKARVWLCSFFFTPEKGDWQALAFGCPQLNCRAWVALAGLQVKVCAAFANCVLGSSWCYTSLDSKACSFANFCLKIYAGIPN